MASSAASCARTVDASVKMMHAEEGRDGKIRLRCNGLHHQTHSISEPAVELLAWDLKLTECGCFEDPSHSPALQQKRAGVKQ